MTTSTSLNISTHCIFGNVEMSYDDMYEGTFRSEPIALATYLEYFSEEDAEEIKEELIDCLKFAIFLKETGRKVEDESDFMDLHDVVSAFEAKHCPIENSLNDETLVCDLVNYKGEGEGVSLFHLVKNLNVFVSKYNYK